MKKTKYSLIILIFILCACKNDFSKLSLVTDDPYIVDAVLHFNATTDGVNIVPHLVTNHSGSLVNNLITNKENQYDIIAGSYTPKTQFNSSELKKIDLPLDYNNFYPFFKDFSNSYQNYILPYRSDFLLIKTSFDNNAIPDIIKYKEFYKQINTLEENLYKDNLTDRHPFISRLSAVNHFEYILFNADIYINNDNKSIFNQKYIKDNIDLYYTNLESNKYFLHRNKLIQKYKSAEKDFFIKRNIMLYDFEYASKFKTNEYKMISVSDLKNASLKQNVICFRKKSYLKKQTLLFISKLLSEEYQKICFNNSVIYSNISRDQFIPIRNHILPIDNYNNQNLLKLKYPNTGKLDQFNLFIKKLNIAEDMIQKERLKPSDLINYLNK